MAVNNSQRPQSTTWLDNPPQNPNQFQLKAFQLFWKSALTSHRSPALKSPATRWRSRRLSGLWRADSCLTRGEDRPPGPEGTWHVPSNALLCWLKRITILRPARQKVSQPPRHPNSSAGRNPAVLSAPISLLCVHCEGNREQCNSTWPAMSTKSRQLHFTCAVSYPMSNS